MPIIVTDDLSTAVVHAVDDLIRDIELQAPCEVDNDSSAAEDSSSTCLSSRPTEIPRLEGKSSAIANTSNVKGKSKEGTPSLATESISSAACAFTLLRPRLPPEILDAALAFLKLKYLRLVCLTNSFLGRIAQRRFYARVTLNSPVRTVVFLQTIIKNPRLAALVRSLRLDVSRQGVIVNGRDGSDGEMRDTSLMATLGETVAMISAAGALVGGLPPNPNGNVNPLLPAANGVPVPVLVPAGPANPPGAAAIPSRLPSPGIAHLTANFYRLLQRALQLMPALTALSLELPNLHSPVWLFEGCSFRLKKFTTSMCYQRPLARFLSGELAEDIEELTLRGFQSEPAFILPFVVSSAPSSGLLTDNDDDDEEENENTFRLPRHALPRLRMFSATYAGSPIVHTIMRRRPVEIASVPLFLQGGLATLDALMTGSATLKRLIVISFDPRPPNFLFDHLTQRFVGLEALYVVMLTAVYSKQSLEDCATFLSRLGNLEKITLMAASTDVADETLDEDDIAERWGKACPRLRVIILPRGKVWFQDEPVPGIWAGQQIIRLGSPILGSV